MGADPLRVKLNRAIIENGGFFVARGYFFRIFNDIGNCLFCSGVLAQMVSLLAQVRGRGGDDCLS